MTSLEHNNSIVCLAIFHSTTRTILWCFSGHTSFRQRPQVEWGSTSPTSSKSKLCFSHNQSTKWCPRKKASECNHKKGRWQHSFKYIRYNWKSFSWIVNGGFVTATAENYTTPPSTPPRLTEFHGFKCLMVKSSYISEILTVPLNLL